MRATMFLKTTEQVLCTGLYVKLFCKSLAKAWKIIQLLHKLAMPSGNVYFGAVCRIDAFHF